LDGFYVYLAFKRLSIPVLMTILAPRLGTLQIGPKKQNYDFLENGCNDFD
jgi:hypothetical protein